MLSVDRLSRSIPVLLLCLFAAAAHAQSFRVQCPTKTSLHPSGGPSATYNGPTTRTETLTRSDGSTFPLPYVDNGGAVKCQQISGGDGFATMADGTQTYLFAFGPLSGLNDILNGRPGTQLPSVFNQVSPVGTGSPSSLVGMPDPSFTFNGAIGLVPDPEPGLNGSNQPICPMGTTSDGGCLTGHVDPRPIMDVGVLNGNQPAPMFAIDEDDEFFLTLTNVGQVMRPDLFEQHTVHFHGYPNASAFYDGVPDASVAINIGASFTYYYLAPDAGTYFWHCHITPPEHLQMGMVGQIFVRPRQNRLAADASLFAGLQLQQTDKRTKCDTRDILCSNPLPAANTATHTAGAMYAYNDGDGTTRYDVDYPMQMMGFDPNFHFVGMTFNPETFTDLKDKYFLLNGRGYPDTVNPDPLSTQAPDGVSRHSQPLPAIVNIPLGGRALLRLSDLNVSEYHTLASLGIPMTVIAINARLLRDQDGNNLFYNTNSITLAGGESLDVILDASDTTKYPGGSTFYLYTPQLDHLSNDAENFGGMMTEVNICPGAVDPATKRCS